MPRRIRLLTLALMICSGVPVVASEQRSSEPVWSVSLPGFLSALFGNLLPGRELAVEEAPSGDSVPAESTETGVTDGRGTLDPDG